MKLVWWSFRGLNVAMIEDDQGNLYCTSLGVRDALGITENSLTQIYSRHREVFKKLSPPDRQTKEFLRANRAGFGIKRVREDMHIWSVKDMMKIARYSTVSSADVFMDELFDFAIENATKKYMPAASYDDLRQQINVTMGRVAAVDDRVATLEGRLVEAQPDLKKAASAAGSALRAQRGIKHLRLVK